MFLTSCFLRIRSLITGWLDKLSSKFRNILPKFAKFNNNCKAVCVLKLLFNRSYRMKFKQGFSARVADLLPARSLSIAIFGSIKTWIRILINCNIRIHKNLDPDLFLLFKLQDRKRLIMSKNWVKTWRKS